MIQFLFSIKKAIAETLSSPPLNIGTDYLGGRGFIGLVASIANGLRIIAVPIVGIMVIVGAFQIMTAGGNPEKYESGKKTILYAAIGFAILLVANAVATIIQTLVTGS